MKSERDIRIFPEKIAPNNQTALTELCIERWLEEEIRWEINMNARLHRNYRKTPDLLVRFWPSRVWVLCCLRFSFFLFLITSPHTVLLLTSKYDGMARALGGWMNGGSFGVESVHLLIFFFFYLDVKRWTVCEWWLAVPLRATFSVCTINNTRTCCITFHPPLEHVPCSHSSYI